MNTLQSNSENTENIPFEYNVPKLNLNSIAQNTLKYTPTQTTSQTPFTTAYDPAQKENMYSYPTLTVQTSKESIPTRTAYSVNMTHNSRYSHPNNHPNPYNIERPHNLGKAGDLPQLKLNIPPLPSENLAHFQNPANVQNLNENIPSNYNQPTYNNRPISGSKLNYYIIEKGYTVYRIHMYMVVFQAKGKVEEKILTIWC